MYYIHFIRNFILILLPVFLATGCFQQDSSDFFNHIQKKQLRIYLHNEPISLVPQIGGNRFSQTIIKHLFEGLFRLDASGTPVRALVSHVDISEDKQTYRFTLRKTVWSDNTPVTAHDFEYAWKKILTQDELATFAFVFYIIKNGEKVHKKLLPPESLGLRVEDTDTLVLELEHHVPNLFEILANPLFYPICKQHVETNLDWHQVPTKFVSNGPFLLADWQHNIEILLKKNPLFWNKDRVSLEEISVAIIENPYNALELFFQHQIDWFGEPLGAVTPEILTTLSQAHILRKRPLDGVFWYQVRTGHPLLQHPKARKAISYAINRDDIVLYLLQGGEMAAYSVMPPAISLISASETQIHPKQSQYKARMYLDEALRDLKLTKEKIPPIKIGWGTLMQRTIAEAVQQQIIKTLNIDCYLEGTDYNMYYKKYCAGDFDLAGMLRIPFSSDSLDALKFFKHYSFDPANGPTWINDRYTEIIELAKNEIDDEKRKIYLKEAEEILQQEMPMIPVYFSCYKYAKNILLEGEILTPTGGLDLSYSTFEKDF